MRILHSVRPPCLDVSKFNAFEYEQPLALLSNGDGTASATLTADGGLLLGDYVSDERLVLESGSRNAETVDVLFRMNAEEEEDEI